MTVPEGAFANGSAHAQGVLLRGCVLWAVSLLVVSAGRKTQRRTQETYKRRGSDPGSRRASWKVERPAHSSILAFIKSY